MAMEREFTATTFIFEEDKTLLIFHKKLRKWLPPGGHLDPHELPHEAAKREALEETGLEITLFSLEEVEVASQVNAIQLPRPYLMLLENIPAHGVRPAHQHIDFIYLSKPKAGELTFNRKETENIHWFSLEQINQLPSKDLFPDTKEILNSLFEKL